MKRIIKTYFKLFIFLFGISLLLVNCEKNNVNNPIESHQIAEINYKSLDELPEIAAALSDINAFGKTNGATSSKTMSTDFGNLSISNILEYVNEDGKETYTFKIEKEIDSLNIFSFENLHLVKVNEDYLAYILKWEPNNEWYESNNYTFVTQYFTGIQKHYDLDYNLLQEVEFINGQRVNYSSSGKNSTPQNTKMDYQIDCDGELGSLCNGVPWDCGGDICGWGFSTYCFNINVGGGGNNDDTSSGADVSGGGTRIPSDNDTSPDLVEDGGATVVVIPLSLEEVVAKKINITNDIYSANSPFDVDMTDIIENIYLPQIDSISTPQDSIINIEVSKKFDCVYKKLTQSPKFKDLFIDIFGENKDINAAFKIVPSLPSSTGNGEAAGTCRLDSYELNPDGTVKSAEIIIKINQKKLTNPENYSNIKIAKVIIHECIHAYLKIKRLDCTSGITLDELNNLEFKELIEEYYDGTCANLQEQHEFMIDYMVPIMQTILSQVRDSLIPETQQEYVVSNPFLDNSGITHPWNWDELYYYMSLDGLHSTETFENEISSDPDIDYLYHQYNIQSQNFSKICGE